MVAFSHLSMVAFVILGLSMVRLMINYSSLLAKNYNESPDDDVYFYWPHTAMSLITFFTIILFWWTSYPLRDLTYYPNEGWNLFTFILYLSVPFLFFMVTEIIAPQPDTYKDKEVDGLTKGVQYLLKKNKIEFIEATGTILSNHEVEIKKNGTSYLSTI